MTETSTKYKKGLEKRIRGLEDMWGNIGKGLLIGIVLAIIILVVFFRWYT